MDTSKPRLDRRIVRSRNAILSAFERLLMDKPLADITVSAIAREANVDRKTFYVHFGTVDGLLDAIAADVLAEKAAEDASGEAKHRYVCKVCGYVYEGDELPADYKCPLCGAGAEYFRQEA